MTAKIKVYVEGQSGTTGLKINERLAAHPYVEVLKIDEARRKDPDARRAMINSADVVFICLPDAAARETVSMVAKDNHRTCLIDASTAHRTHSDWTYGLPELSREAREAIRSSRQVAVPGCHASAFILPLYPLVKQGIVPADYPIASHSITGYSGGGKQMIAEYTDAQRQVLYPDHDAPREYALGQKHKHIPEMQKAAGLAFSPSFSPIVGDFERGLAVFTPLQTRLLKQHLTPAEVHQILEAYYQGQTFVKVMPFVQDLCIDSAYFNVKACNNTNRAEIFVFGNSEQILLACRLDNLGKGASGAAVQNMNLMNGFPETLSLE